MPASVSSPSPELQEEAARDDRDPHVASDRPYPQRLRTPAKLDRLGVRNRRHEYLVKTPSYFDNLDHELAGTVPRPSLSLTHTLSLFLQLDSFLFPLSLIHVDDLRVTSMMSSHPRASECEREPRQTPLPNLT